MPEKLSLFYFANSRRRLKNIPFFVKIGTSMDARFGRKGLGVGTRDNSIIV